MKQLPMTLTDHPSLIGIIRFPGDCYGEKQEVNIPIIRHENGKWENVIQPVEMSKTIKSQSPQSQIYNISKNSITDFYPYTYYVLTDGECEPLILYPQYMPNNVIIKGEIALSHQPIERYYIESTSGEGYKGDKKGHCYNITNLNQMMLPTATNEGISYLSANANTISQNRKSAITNNVLGVISSTLGTVGSIATGNALGIGGSVASGINSTINGFNEILKSDARHKDITLTPNSISSFGTPSTRDKFDNNKVRLLKYTIKDKYKTKVNNFVNRFGYKYNNYTSRDLSTYKGYVKMVMPNINSKIDNIYTNKIISILERGIYIE